MYEVFYIKKSGGPTIVKSRHRSLPAAEKAARSLANEIGHGACIENMDNHSFWIVWPSKTKTVKKPATKKKTACGSKRR